MMEHSKIHILNQYKYHNCQHMCKVNLITVMTGFMVDYNGLTVSQRLLYMYVSASKYHEFTDFHMLCHPPNQLAIICQTIGKLHMK